MVRVQYTTLEYDNATPKLNFWNTLLKFAGFCHKILTVFGYGDSQEFKRNWDRRQILGVVLLPKSQKIEPTF